MRRSTGSIAVIVGALLLAVIGNTWLAGEERPPVGGELLAIHEWGTFTSLQNEAGQSIAGVNTDDEPVPRFVHRLANLINEPSELAPVYYKGVPRSHRGVVMRLETPVIYFHPPASQREPMQVDVRVDFRGGWLTEYYPDALANAPGLREGGFRFGSLTPQTTSSLEWRSLTVGVDARGPETNMPVWTAPRQVQAAAVRNSAGESEKYLFYRGVGNIVAPLSVERNAQHDSFTIREQLDSAFVLRPPFALRAMWLAHIREDGAVAYRTVGKVALTAERGSTVAKIPASFEAAAYSPQNLPRLRQEMREALIADGLFADEAEAMLNTWQLAYFKSAGLRLFFLLPQQWTDAVLPLHCSVPADVSRTMVGRIELVTPRQRGLLRQISTTPGSKQNWFYKAVEGDLRRSDALAQLWEGRLRFSDFNLPVPADYQAYIDLGRFRNALILDEQERHPGSGLARFVDEYHLGYYTPTESP